MTSDPAHIFSALVDRGLISPTHTVRNLAGNADRKPARARAHFLVQQAGGLELKITLGHGLAEPRARAAEFARQLPQICPREIFFTQIGDVDVWATAAVAGILFEDLDRDGAAAARLLSGLDALERELQTTATPFDEAAFLDEWEAFLATVLALPCWTALDQVFLRERALPALRARLRPKCGQSRWTNGDFTSTNGCLAAHNEPMLFDTEFAARAIFFAEDVVRFRRISPLCHRHPGLLAGWWGTPDAAWEVFFQFRQLVLEFGENAAAYLERCTPTRQAAIRFFGESWMPGFPGSWPKPTAPAPVYQGETVQLFWRGEHDAFAEERSISVEYPAGCRQFVGLKLPGGFPHWRLDPVGNERRVRIHSLTPVLPDLTAPAESISWRVEGASVERNSEGSELRPHGPDPQIHFTVPRGTIGLVVELHCLDDSPRDCAPSPSPEPHTGHFHFHLDRAEWLIDDRAPIGISGWCVRVDGRPIARLTARVGERELATMEPLARDDVAAALPLPSARMSGFNLYLPFLELEETIRLLADDADGTSLEFWAMRAGDLPGRSAIITDYAELRARGWGNIEPASNPPPKIHRATPLFSILLPVYNTPAHFLRECIDSVMRQSFPHWEIVVVDDCSSYDSVIRTIREFVFRDPRIRLDRSTARGGISRTSNWALALARGDFVVPLDHDDRLLPHALATLAAAIDHAGTAGGRCDALYSDEEKILENGAPARPILKPAFSPEFFRGVMYVGHVVCVRRLLAIATGGYNPAFDGIQDYEFFLRISEKTRSIVHIPEVLYQWRISATSSALLGNVKGDMDTLQVQAVQAHLARTGREARVRALGAHRAAVEPPEDFVRPSVTLFATAEAASSPAIQELTHVQIVVLDTTWTKSRLACPDRAATELLRSPAFASVPATPLIALVAEPIVEASPRWLDHLAFLAMEAEAGAVSPILRSIEGKVLEAGQTATPAGQPVSIMRGFDPNADGYNGSLKCHREVLSASPICWGKRVPHGAESPRAFDRVCATAWIRLNRSWTDHASSDPQPSDTSADPFFNPRFDRDHADYRLAPLKTLRDQG